MRKIRMLALLLCLLAMVISLTGCFTPPEPTEPPTAPPTTPPTEPPTEPPLTAERVMELMQQAVDGRKPHQASLGLDVDLTMEMKQSGFRISVDMAMDLDMDLQMDMDTNNMYAELTMTMESMGQSQTSQSQLYYVTEDGQTVYYAYSVTDDFWTTAELGEVDGADKPTDALPTPKLTLDAQTVTVGKKEAYVLRFDLTEEHLKVLIPAIPETGITPLNLAETNEAPAATASVALYVDAETYLPLQFEVDLQNMDDMINDLLPNDMGIPGMEMSNTVRTANEQTITFEFANCLLTLRDLSFDPVEIPAVPEEAFACLAMYEHDPLQEDGSFLLVELGSAVRLELPEGWEALDRDYHYLFLSDEAGEHYAEITLYPKMGDPYMRRIVLGTYITPLENAGILDYYSYGTMIWKYNIIVAYTHTGETVYLAWGQTKNGWVLISVTDYCDNACPVDEILKPFIVSIKDAEPIN